MRYFLNVYLTGFVYIGLRFYTAWAESGLKQLPHRCTSSQSAVQLLDPHHSRNTRAPYNALMTTQLKPDLHRKAKLLVAAVQLRKTHGLLYVMSFLEDYGFVHVVVWEVLNLIPPGKTEKHSQ